MMSAISVAPGLLLELIDDQHAEPVFELIRANRPHLSQWLPWVGRMRTLEDFRGYIHLCKQQHAAGTDYGYVILQHQVPVGRIGIHYIDRQNHSAAIGYWLGENFQGQGIISQACKALLQQGFTRLGLNRIEIKCGTGNTKSAAIAGRLGFFKEGILRQAEWVNGKFIDLNLYSMLKDEWLLSGDLNERR